MQDTVNLDGRGTYALILANLSPMALAPGGQVPVILPPGILIYVGSALGPGGLASRVGRHLRHHKTMRWHIDWLTTALPVQAVWVDASGRRLECQWAEILLRSPGVTIPVAGFGSSDCRCQAHLFSCHPGLLTNLHHALGSPGEIKTGAY